MAYHTPGRFAHKSKPTRQQSPLAPAFPVMEALERVNVATYHRLPATLLIREL